MQHAWMLAAHGDVCSTLGCLQDAAMPRTHREVCNAQGCLQHARLFAAASRDAGGTQESLQRAGIFAARGGTCGAQGCLQRVRMFAACRDARTAQRCTKPLCRSQGHPQQISGFPCLGFPFPESKHRTRARRFARGSASQDTAVLGNLAVLQLLGWRLCIQRLEGGQEERWGPAACQM